jgi:23S rRNA (guanine2445-N2)-methyltransferase / 23S rRNA (guanine2069-N7)-methyltransferase
VRLEDRDGARALMKELGGVLREHFGGWDAVILSGSADAGLELGIRAERVHTIWNGALECRLLRLNVSAESSKTLLNTSRTARIDESLADSPGSKMFGNRVAKNLKQLEKWAERESVTCYRIYDADMPEYSFAIDRYREADSDRTWLYVQEYAAPKDHRPGRGPAAPQRGAGGAAVGHRYPGRVHPPAAATRQHARPAVREVRRTRRVQAGRGGRAALLGELHRLPRHRACSSTTASRARDCARPPAASVSSTCSPTRAAPRCTPPPAARVRRRRSTCRLPTSIGLSAIWLSTASRGRNMSWCRRTASRGSRDAVAARRQYDLVFLDPPTFSNSKRMDDILDVQRDHRALIDRCMALLAPGGKLVFSNNAQKFRMDTEVGQSYKVTDISRATLPRDFERNPRIHQCFELEAGK